MRRALLLQILTAGFVWTLPASATNGERKRTESTVPILIKTVHQAQTLPHHVRSVRVDYNRLVDKDAKAITAILKALVTHGGIRKLDLRTPNSKGITMAHLDLLKDFRGLESLELTDQRDWKSPEIFSQVAAIKGLRHLKMRFG